MRESLLKAPVQWLSALVRATNPKELMQSLSEMMPAKQTREQIQLLLMQVAVLFNHKKVGFMLRR